MPTVEPPQQASKISFVSQQGSTYKYTINQAEKLSIKIKATDRCWVQVREGIHGKVIGEALLTAGKEQVFEAPKTAYIRLGKPSAVQILLNEVPMVLTDVKMTPANLDITAQ